MKLARAAALAFSALIAWGVAAESADGCTVACDAWVPLTGTSGTPVGFLASATPSGCAGAVSYLWTFGDGQTSAEQNASHAYAAAGAYTWTLLATADGVPCTRQGSIVIAGGGCTVACSATVPASGTRDVPVQFQASAIPTGCAGAPAYSWDFGDGLTSSLQNPSHAYAATGNFAWTLTVSADGATCESSGAIGIAGPPCTLACAAAAPATAQVGIAASFSASATPTDCTGSAGFVWTFGDGCVSTLRDPVHVYTSPGSYSWSMVASAEDATCSEYGSIRVVTPPLITRVKRLSSPFRLRVDGTGFHPGCTVLINDVPAPATVWKSGSKLIAEKGAALKAMAPAGQMVQVRVHNGDDGGLSAPYSFTR